MRVTINGCELNVEVMGPEDSPVPSPTRRRDQLLAEPKATFGPLSDRFVSSPSTHAAADLAKALPPYSHAQWAADVDSLRQWIGADEIDHHAAALRHRSSSPWVCRAPAYPRARQAIVLRDTAADAVSEGTSAGRRGTRTRSRSARDNFNRYWTGQIRDDEDLKARWAEIIPLYDYEYDPVRSSAEGVEAGIYHHEAHNWCFQHSRPTTT